jgi:hypothetical protein
MSMMDWHFVVADTRGIRHFVEHHQLGLFSRDEYLAAIAAAGLHGEVLQGAADGRDRYLGLSM